jgi:PAS domain S-box-containing protein
MAVLLAVLLATSAMLIADSWTRLRVAGGAEARNHAAGELILVALDLAAERGMTYGSLNSALTASRLEVDRIMQRREASAAKYQSVLRWIAENPGVLTAETTTDLIAAAEKVEALRADVDTEIRLPLVDRDRLFAGGWRPAMSDFLEVLRRAIDELGSPATALDTQLQTVFESRMAAFDLRNAAGERAALTSGVLGAQRTVSRSEAVLIGSRREATELIWKRLQRLSDVISDPRIDQSLAEARYSYFDRYRGLLDRVTAAGLGGVTYPISLAAFFTETGTALRSLNELVLATQALSTETLAQRVTAAENRLYVSLAAIVAGMAVAGFPAFAFSRRVLRPIEQITDAMRRLAAGTTPAADLPVAQADEIGEMSRAIAAFRDAMIASETALSDAERFMRQTIDALPSHIAVLDENGIIIAANRSWHDFAVAGGGPRIAHEGQSYLQTCDKAADTGDDGSATVAAGLRAVLDGTRAEFETEYPCPAPAGVSWYRMRVSRFGVSGPVRLIVVHDDISGRKLAEEGLQEKNRLLELAEQMSSTGHWRLELKGKALRWSSEIYRIYGQAPADFTPDVKSTLAACHPEDRHTLVAVAIEALRTGIGFTLDLRLFRSDGQLRSVEVMAGCERNAEGRVSALSGVFRDISDRKKAEERLAGLNIELERRVAAQTAALSAREAYLRGILDNVAEMVMTIDEDDRIESFNPAAERAFGYAASEVIGQHVDLLANRTGRHRDETRVSDHLRPGIVDAGDATSREIMALRKDGTNMPVELTVAEMRIAGRVRYVAAIQDITERKRAELALRDSEARLRAIFDHAPVTISLRDVAGHYVMVNRRFQELFDQTEDEIVGRTPQEFYPPRFAGEIVKAIDQVRRTKGTVVSEEGAPTIYGDRRYLTTRFPVVDGAGRLSGIGSISVDVTDQRAAEAALRESEARLRAIFDSEPECVALLADDSSLLEINPAGLAMVEAADARAILGHRLDGLIEPGYREAFRGLMGRVFDGGSGSLLFEMTGLAGGRRWMEMNAVPLRDPDSAITSMLSIARDVTGQHDTEEQLRQAQKMEAVGQLTGGIAHDFNNLLGVIVGNLDLLSLKLAAESTERNLVERAVAAAERGGALTHRLLAFARRQTLVPQQVESGQLVTEVAQLLRRTIGERIELKIDVEPGLAPCYVDPGQLETALVNLAINARDAMPEGGVMTIKAVAAVMGRGDEAQSQIGGPVAGTGMTPGDYIIISVADTGQGMDDEVRARAFEPF